MSSQTERWVDGCLHYIEGIPLRVVLPAGYCFVRTRGIKTHIAPGRSKGLLCGYPLPVARRKVRPERRLSTAAVCQFCIGKLRKVMRDRAAEGGKEEGS